MLDSTIIHSYHISNLSTIQIRMMLVIIHSSTSSIIAHHRHLHRMHQQQRRRRRQKSARNSSKLTVNNHNHESKQVCNKIGEQQHLLFAVQELDEATIGRISFRQKDQWLTLMNDAGDSINSLNLAVRLQLMHNHFVYTAILQHRLAIVCITQQLQTTHLDSGSEQIKSQPTGRRHSSSMKIIF